MNQDFRVEFVGLPDSWAAEGRISLHWQNRVRPPAHSALDGESIWMSVPVIEGRWTGHFVGRNSDGRRFVYFAWCNQFGRMFRRIKLYQDQVVGDVVRVKGTMKDGSPACSTAQILN